MLETCEVQETKRSTHKVEVIPVVMEPHGNADSLSVVKVFGYTCCVRTQDWQGIRLAAWVPPDSLVDVTRTEFAFLLDQAKTDGKARIKAKKLRGVVSFGLLVPAPAGAQVGDDLADALGVEHWEPDGDGKRSFITGVEVAAPPSVSSVKYDLDAFRRYHHLFELGEPCVVTEKLDGSSARYVWWDGQMHCGSRKEWKKEYPDYSCVTAEKLISHGKTPEEAEEILTKLSGKKKKNLWWDLLERTPAIEKFCRDNPGLVLHGENFGNVNNIKYFLPEVTRFAAFDVMQDGRWMDHEEARDLGKDLCWVPSAGIIPFDFEKLCQLAEGPTLVPDAKMGTIREGIVIGPLKERWNERVGRVKFKCVSSAYLEKY